MTDSRFIGPISKKSVAVSALKSLGFREVETETDSSETLTWEEAFPEYEDSPGIVLSGARYKEGLTQKQLSKLTGIPQANISEMERGKRQIGVAIAKKLGKALDINYKVFL